VTGDGALQVTVLGCNGTYAAPDGACTGYLLRGGGRTILLDCGPGTLARLQNHVDPRSLDAVIVTHCHPDHWVELPVLRNVLKYVLRRDEPLPLLTTAETLTMAEVVSRDPMLDTFAPTIISDGSEERVGHVRVRFSRTDHPVETLAVRVDVDGRSFAFSSDTGPGWSLTALSDGDGIDLAFVESTYVDSTFPPTAPHLTAGDAARMATDARVRKLVLTHLLPGEDPKAHLAEARDSFGGPLSVANIDERYDV
jgi:ribonuclease BN (tRNA processing enzyme)